ncbi:MAG: hypothetical protein DDT27_00542 [Dehalococcoidia bacterium]|nr:hypothetical protein [Chloroflexota bacterium]MBT9158817.1 hypothetical protein [Chloroflexota bacterium]MBT9161999.1 hypothetical protein [Chloroflexota bacterium]
MQNQAFNALLFLFRDVLNKQMEDFIDSVPGGPDDCQQ